MSANIDSAFVAYPAQPEIIGQMIEAAKSERNKVISGSIKTWRDTNNWGSQLIYPILEDISESKRFYADITKINFNVIFEIGYAIALGRRPLLLMNKGLENDRQIYERAGVFDTIGFREYENSTQLANLFLSENSETNFSTTATSSRRQPIYVLLEPTASEVTTRVISRVKKSRLRYRSFDPNEDFRLSPLVAVEQVSKSIAVIVTLLSREHKNYQEHNLRACFLAGLSHGFGKKLFIVQSVDGPNYLDLRDMVVRFREVDELNDRLDELLFDVHNERLEISEAVAHDDPLLSRLRLGDPLAENEMVSLEEYFLETDSYFRLLRGEINLVVGRKGTGKTALWIRVRDRIRGNKNNIVVDLKPEGYQLVKLKEEVLKFLSEGARLHLITAFWEFLIYTEIAYKLIEKDSDRHRRDHKLYEEYIKLEEGYNSLRIPGGEGDFSERLRHLASTMIEKFSREFTASESEKISLGNDDITNLLRSGMLSSFKSIVKSYLSKKRDLWVLFDNLDKGWAAFGLDPEDVFILRCLIEASRKVQRELRGEDRHVQCVVFVRNDIYQLLMKENPDFGKESRVTLDWSHHDTLRELVLRRLAFGISVPVEDISGRLNEIVAPIYKGEDTIQYLMNIAMMRPRNLIRLLILSRSYAVNLRHGRIEEDDVESAIAEFSDDILSDVNNELRDVERKAENILYHFIGGKKNYESQEVVDMLRREMDDESASKVFDYLLYYGVLGVRGDAGDLYIYNLSYDMNKIHAWSRRFNGACVLHPALYPSLGVQ